MELRRWRWDDEHYSTSNLDYWVIIQVSIHRNERIQFDVEQSHYGYWFPVKLQEMIPLDTNLGILLCFAQRFHLNAMKLRHIHQ